MFEKQALMQLGFIKDEDNSWLKQILKDDTKLKEVYIDTYPNNPLISFTPHMLLSRTVEENIIVSNNGYRLVLYKSDRYKSHIMNVVFDEITGYFHKNYNDCFEFVLNIQNTYIKLTVLN